MNIEELEAYITKLVDSDSDTVLELQRGGVLHGGKAESVKVVGVVDEYRITNRVSGENVRQD